MPDHIHGIIILHDTPTVHSQPTRTQTNGTQPGSLPAIMQRFKSQSTKLINKANNTPGERFWQEDYYERIVRNTTDLDRIRQYIAANPARWNG
jgi:REP element-mobilizing transposase RayT